MKTIATGRIGEEGEATLFVDILADPPGAAIRRQDGGLVRIEAGEMNDLIRTLIHVADELTDTARDRGPVINVVPVRCAACGCLMYLAMRGPEHYCPDCQEVTRGEDPEASL